MRSPVLHQLLAALPAGGARSAVIATLAALSLAGAPGPVRADDEPPEHGKALPPRRPIVDAPPEHLVKKGRQVFVARCARCHGETGDGRGPEAAKLDPPPRDLRHGHYKLRTTPGGTLPTDEDLARTIRRGIPGTAMQPQPLHVDDLKAVVAFLKTLHLPGRYSRFRLEKQGTPIKIPRAPRLTWQRAERGRQVYMIFRCWRCHGVEGKGNGMVAKRLRDRIGFHTLPADLTARPFKTGSRPEEIFRVIATGMDYTPMPPWPVDRLGILPNYADREYQSLPPSVVAEFRAYMAKEPKVTATFVDRLRREKLGTERMWDLVSFIYSLRPRDHHRLAGPRPKPRVP